MVKGAFRGACVLALTVASVVGCSGEVTSKPGDTSTIGEGSRGQLGIELVPIAGVQINVVRYIVTQGVNGAVVVSGYMPVYGSERSFSFGVPLPVGSGYVLSLEARSANGVNVHCTGSAGPFSITANQIVDVTATLSCVDVSTGQTGLEVDVVTSACPDITFEYVVATPPLGLIGEKDITLRSRANSASGALLTYSWQIEVPAVGTFVNPTLADSVLTCTSYGNNVVVTTTANNGECTKSLSTRVSCISTECGDGVVNPGETCDTALDPSCPADCTQVCGDGVVEGTERCEPPNTLACRADCTARFNECGDGFFSPGEACDWSATPTGAPLGAPCNHDCSFNPVTPCGNGVVDASETCDPLVPYSVPECGGFWGPATAVAGGGRDSSCRPITPAACLACEMSSDCSVILTSNLLVGNAQEGPALGVARTALYHETLDCLRDSQCADDGLTIDCYCGTVSEAECDAGLGNGACRAVIERGLETTNPELINRRFTNATLGAGVALARLACDQLNCPECF